MKVRFSPDLKQQIEDAAAENNRTLNAEIVHRLTVSFAMDGSGGALDADVAFHLNEIQRRLDRLEKLMTTPPGSG